MKGAVQALVASALVALVACNEKPERHALSTDLFDAARLGQVENIDRLVSQGKLIDELNSEGDSPLMVAVGSGHLLVAKALVSKGANVHIKHASGANLLMIAVGLPKGPIVPIIDYLLQLGLDPNELDQGGRGALEVAVDQKNEEAVRRLLVAGARPTQRVAEMVNAPGYPSQEIVREITLRTSPRTP